MHSFRFLKRAITTAIAIAAILTLHQAAHAQNCNLPVSIQPLQQPAGTGASRTLTVNWTVDPAQLPSCVKIIDFKVKVRLMINNNAQGGPTAEVTVPGTQRTANVTVNNVSGNVTGASVEVTGRPNLYDFLGHKDEGSGGAALGERPPVTAPPPACGVNLKFRDAVIMQSTANSRVIRVRWAASFQYDRMATCGRIEKFSITPLKLIFPDGQVRQAPTGAQSPTVNGSERQATVTIDTTGIPANVAPASVDLIIHISPDQTNDSTPVITIRGTRAQTFSNE